MATRTCTRVFLLLLVVLLLLSPSYGGAKRRFFHSYLVQREPKIELATTMPLDEDAGEVRKHGRILRVHTNDYGSYDPSPSIDKPPSKDIPH